MIITKIEKVKNILNLTTGEGKIYKIDFSTGDIIGIRGKVLKSDPLEYATVSIKVPFSSSWKRFFESGSFFQTYYGENKKVLRQQNEQFCSYMDLLPTDRYCCYTRPKKIPKGYVNWCRERNQKISQESLTEFYLEQELIKQGCSKRDYLRIANLKEYLSSNIIKFLVDNKEIRKILFTILENDYKIFRDVTHYQVRDIIEYMNSFGIDFIDITAGIQENYILGKDYLDKHKEQMILNQEQKINELENIENDTYCVIVPKTLQDFTDEGQQQRNCVGHYYHDSIARGENLIYFIRYKNNPTHSLNTCRFNINDNETMENRTYCNRGSSKEVIDFIATVVDPKIRELLNS
jgi:hypothetical protein